MPLGKQGRGGLYASVLVNEEKERLRSEQLGRRSRKPIVLLF